MPVAALEAWLVFVVAAWPVVVVVVVVFVVVVVVVVVAKLSFDFGL